ncbi:MAG: DMT family transporter [Candidatus Lutacidiplasmatales archaeon]
MTSDADRRNLILLVVLGLVWGSAYPVIRFGLLIGSSPLAFAAARYAFSAVAIAVLAAATRVARPSARGLLLSALIGIPIVAVYGALLYVGEQTTSGSLAAILIGATPLLTALFALPVLPGESLGRAGYVGMAVGFLGVVVLVFPPPGVTLASSVWGPVAVFGAGLSVAAGSVALRRAKPEGETLWGVSVQFVIATVILTAILPVAEPNPTLAWNTDGILALAYLIALPSVVGYTLYFYLHHQVGPARANVVAYVNPVAAVSIGTLLFAEPFQIWELVGFAFVIIGLTILTRYGRPKPALAGTEAPGQEGAPAQVD